MFLVSRFWVFGFPSHSAQRIRCTCTVSPNPTAGRPQGSCTFCCCKSAKSLNKTETPNPKNLTSSKLSTTKQSIPGFVWGAVWEAIRSTEQQLAFGLGLMFLEDKWRLLSYSSFHLLFHHTQSGLNRFHLVAEITLRDSGSRSTNNVRGVI